MRAVARLDVERVGGRTVVRTLAGAAPLSLVPRRGEGPTTVHLVGSAAGPLGGDDLELHVTVGPGAELRLVGIAATLALTGPSRTRLHIDIADGGACAYLPEPVVLTRHAHHHARLDAELAATARLRVRETLVLGRIGEPPGALSTETHLVRAGTPLLRQRLDLGDPEVNASPAGLAGHRVLAAELLVCPEPAPASAAGQWWSLTPLAAGGAVATALAHDVVTARTRLDTATRCWPAFDEHPVTGSENDTGPH